MPRVGCPSLGVLGGGPTAPVLTLLFPPFFPTGSLPVWLLLLLCAGLIVATILLLQLAFPGFL